MLLAGIVASIIDRPAAAVPVTGWLGDPLIPNGATVVITGANTASPIIGDRTLDSADRAGVWAAFPMMSLASGDIITLTGSVTIVGTSPSANQFRWGLFGDNGSPDTTEWLGFLAGQSNGATAAPLASKDPAGTNFADSSSLSTGSGRGFTLGTAGDPQGDTWADATYDFGLSVERREESLIVNASLTSEDARFTDGWRQEWTNLSETEMTRITHNYNRVGVLSGNGTNIDQIVMQDIDVSLSQSTTLTLEVDPRTGTTRIINHSDQNIEINGYEISSPSGSLDPIGWSSLDEQDIDAVDRPGDADDIAGNSIGEGWDEAGGSDSNVLSEVFLLRYTTLGVGESLSLGSAFGVGGDQDLQFNFTIFGDTRVTVGFIEESSIGGILGDYDHSGLVAQGDLDLVLLNWGADWPPSVDGWDNDQPTDGKIDQDDLDVVILNWGNSSAGEDAAVPEPSTIWLTFTALAVVVGFSRRCP